MALEDVIEVERINGKPVRERLACGHIIDVRKLLPNKTQRRCSHPDCKGKLWLEAGRAKAVKEVGESTKRLERLIVSAVRR